MSFSRSLQKCYNNIIDLLFLQTLFADCVIPQTKVCIENSHLCKKLSLQQHLQIFMLLFLLNLLLGRKCSEITYFFYLAIMQLFYVKVGKGNSLYSLIEQTIEQNSLTI